MAGKIDRILKTFTKMITELDKTAVFHEDEAYSHSADAALHQGMSDQHFAEAKRANALKAKVQDLITV